MNKAVVRRFWNHVNVAGKNECWLWNKGKNKFGYGRFLDGTRVVFAHRLSFELRSGPIPSGLLCCHKCDVPACVNPNHLFLGTHKDNTRDMYAKGRGHGGPNAEKPGRYRILNEREVLEIRKRYESHQGSYRSLGREFRVSEIEIAHIIKRRTWADL